MRVIDCDCGCTVQAANDDDLFGALRGHIEEIHPEIDLSDERVRELIEAQAYDASDA